MLNTTQLPPAVINSFTKILTSEERELYFKLFFLEEQIYDDVRKAFNDLPDFIKEQMAAEMESSFTDIANDLLNADEDVSKVEVFKIVARQIDKLIRVIFSYEELHKVIRLICIKYDINFETYLQLVFKLGSWLSGLTDEEVEVCLE